MKGRIAALFAAEQEVRQFDVHAFTDDGLLCLRVSYRGEDRLLWQVLPGEWAVIKEVGDSALAGGRGTVTRPDCAVCGLRVRPLRDGTWAHCNTRSGRDANKGHAARPAVASRAREGGGAGESTGDSAALPDGVGAA